MSSEALANIMRKQPLSEKIKIMFLSKNEQIKMQNEFIREVKPLFTADLSENPERSDVISIHTAEVFDERIRTLPKEMLYDLYRYLILYKETENLEDKQVYLSALLYGTELSYSLDRWYTNKIVEYIRNN